MIKAEMKFEFIPQEKTFLDWMFRIKSKYYHKLDADILKTKNK